MLLCTNGYYVKVLSPVKQEKVDIDLTSIESVYNFTGEKASMVIN